MSNKNDERLVDRLGFWDIRKYISEPITPHQAKLRETLLKITALDDKVEVYLQRYARRRKKLIDKWLKTRKAV